MINIDQLHFVAAKKKAQFKIKTKVGPFFCNAKATCNEAENLFKQIYFKLSFTRSSDPLGVISKLMVEQKTIPYIHSTRPEIKQFMNHDEWQENKLQEAKEQAITSTPSQTPLREEKQDKRPGDSASPMETQTSTKGFKIYSKRKKITSTSDTHSEDTTQ